MSASFHFWICDETAKARKLSTIQASAAIPTHLSTRRHGGRTAGSFSTAGRVGRLPLPLTRSRSVERSGDRRRLSRAARQARPDVVAAGLGIPCTIDRQRGVALVAVNLEIDDVPVRELMTERLGLPVFLDNDANVTILAEHRFGAARGARNAVMLTIGTGIGGGLIVDGRLYRGSTGAGAELGHIVIDAHGPRCQGNCSNRGCLEALASGTAIAR